MLCFGNTNIKWACVGCAGPGACSSDTSREMPPPAMTSVLHMEQGMSLLCCLCAAPQGFFCDTFIHQGFFWCLSMTWVTSHLSIKHSDLEYEHLNNLYKTLERIKLEEGGTSSLNTHFVLSSSIWRKKWKCGKSWDKWKQALKCG